MLENDGESIDLQYHIFRQSHFSCFHVWPVQDLISAVFCSIRRAASHFGRTQIVCCTALTCSKYSQQHAVHENTPWLVELLSYHHPPSVSRAQEWNWAHLPRVETCSTGETTKLVLCLMLIDWKDFESDRGRHIRKPFFKPEDALPRICHHWYILSNQHYRCTLDGNRTWTLTSALELRATPVQLANPSGEPSMASVAEQQIPRGWIHH